MTTLLETLRTLYPPANDADEAVVLLLLQELTTLVCAACNRTDVPRGLEITIARMAAYVLKAEAESSSLAEVQAGHRGVSAITRGDTIITYEKARSASDAGELYAEALDAYKGLWRAFRKARGVP